MAFPGLDFAKDLFYDDQSSTDDELLHSGPTFASSAKSKSKNGKKDDAETVLRTKFQEILNAARFELNVDAYRGIFTSLDKDSGKLEYYAACFRRLDVDSTSLSRYAGISCPTVQSWLDQEMQENTKKGTIGKKNKNKQSKHEILCKDCDCNPLCFVSLGGVIQDCLSEQIRPKNATSLNVAMATGTTVDLAADDSSTESNTNEPDTKRPKLDSKPSLLLQKVIPCDDYEENQVDTLQHLDKFEMKSTHSSGKNNYNAMEEETPRTPQASITSDSNMQISSERHTQITPKFPSSKNLNDDIPQAQDDVYSSPVPHGTIAISSKLQKKAAVSKTKERQDMHQIRNCNYLNRHDIAKYFQSISIEKHSSNLDTHQLIDKIHFWHSTLLGNSSPSSTLNDVSYCMPPGLTNLGATCYLNSLFQCLAFNVPMMDGILSWTPPSSSITQDDFDNDDDVAARKKKIRFLTELQLLLARMTLGPSNTLDTVNLIAALGLSVDEMQDPHEFSKLLFDLIHRSFKEITLESTAVPKRLVELLPDTFGGVSVFKTTCTKCGNCSFRNQGFLDVSLPIITQEPQTTSTSKKRNATNLKKKTETDDSMIADPTVQDCLNRYLESEQVSEYFCERCKSKQDVDRCMLFEKLPPVLNVHLLRYDFDLKTFQRKKLMDKILLSKTIHVPMHKRVKKKMKENGTKTYTLCAVQLHRGASAHGGHYIAEVMDWLTGTWMQFNDNDVEILRSGSSCTLNPEIDRGDVDGSSDAYSLFYVEQSFLASQVSKQITRISDGRYTENCSGIVQQVTHERIEYQRLKAEMQLQEKMLNDRLADRKRSLMQTFLPELDEEARSHKSGDILYWVHRDILRRFISCEDGMEDILSQHCLLSNKSFLCDHGIGLHPSKAREGKMMTKRSYDSLIQLLKKERDVFLLQSKDNAMHRMVNFKDTDVEVTNRSNLFCQHCVDTFRSDLRTRVEFFDAAQKLLQVFDDDDYTGPVEVDDNDDGECKYVVSKQFVSSFQRIMKQRMKDVVNQGHEGIDRLDLKLIAFDDEAIDLRVNTSITCPFRNCHSAFNKKLVRYVSPNTWSNLQKLFPAAICHKVKINETTENNRSVLCEDCLRDQERKMDLSTNISSWGNRAASDDFLSKILSESANHLVEMKTVVDKSPGQLRYYIVHKDDLDEWRSAVNHVCATFSSIKGKDTGKGRKIKSHIEQRLFKVHGDTMSDDSRNEQFLHDFKFQSLLCRDHGFLLGHLSPIDEILSYIPEHRLTRYSGDSTLDLNNKVELLTSDEYKAYLTSLHDLAEALVLPISTSDKKWLEGLSGYKYHPHVTIINDKAAMEEFSGGTGYNILSMDAGTNGCRVSFEPKLCMNRCCWDAWTAEMSQQKCDNTLLVTNTETKEPIDVDQEVKESWSQSSSVSFQVYEIPDDTDMAAFGAAVTQERNPPPEGVDSSGARNTRRSYRNRKKCTFVVTAEKDANVAKLKLLVSEKTKIEHISEIAFYLYLDNLLELGDTTNETILSKLLGDVNMINDPILLLQIQSNDDQLKKSDRRERDEAIMGHLMSLVGDCRTSGRMKTEERGFQGTMLHSAPTRKNLSNGPVVEVID